MGSLHRCLGPESLTLGLVYLENQSFLRPSVLEMEFCPNNEKGVAVFAMFANIF